METIIESCSTCCIVALFPDTLTVVGDDSYCYNCYRRDFADCTSCHGSYRYSELHTFDGEYYCEDCYGDSFTECERCNTVVNNDGIRCIDGDTICDSCVNDYYVTCEACRAIVEDSDTNRINYANYCNSCTDEHFIRCDGCGELERDYEVTFCEDSEQSLCDSCRSSSKSRSIIHNYSFKPTTKFFGSGSNVYLGIELEIDGGTDNDETAKSIEADFLYFKEDGSLTNGFEIVSHPCTFEYLKDKRKDFELMFKSLIEKGYKSFSTDTCGIHIHISKKAFTTWHLYRFLKFFQENKKFVLDVSQRKERLFKGYANIDGYEFSDNCILDKSKKKTTSCDRYQAVNLNNSNTVEIRIFRGTLKVESFYKNIQFVQALYQFTLQVSLSEINLPNFKQFLFKNTEFKDLTNFIKDKNL